METLSDLFDSIMGDDFFKFPPMSVKTAVSYPMRFGWHYRRSTHYYEFWWGRTEPLVIVTDEYLMTMPNDIVREIEHAINDKGEGAYLD
jgi:hypothetical protein